MIKGINQAARVDQAKRESVKNADKNLLGQKASDQILESDKIAIAKTNSIAKEIEAKAVERIGTMDEAEKVSQKVLPFEEKALQTQGNISKQSAESLIIA
jgi:hypothetical protein